MHGNGDQSDLSFIARVQSTAFFNCSSVMKINMVVGWRRVQAGTHPRNINIAPSFLNEFLMTCMVDLESAPDALMMRLLRTSAGEQTVVATVPAAKDAVVCRPMLSSK